MTELPALRVLTKYTRRGPSSRLRFHAYAPHLAAAGFATVFSPLLDDAYLDALLLEPTAADRALATAFGAARGVVRRMEALERCDADTPAIVEQQLFPRVPFTVERPFLQRLGAFAVDFDDAVYLSPGNHPKLARVLAMSRCAVVGNTTLAEYAARTAPRVEIVPTVLDMDAWPKRSSEPEGPFTVGWIGLPYNFPYLASLAEPMAALRREMPEARLRVISSRPPQGLPFAVDFVPWREEGECALLQSCHVGVMPLPDTDWERGKCAFKLLQYMAAGVPAVASPVGMNRDVVAHGVNGLLAATAGEWTEALLDLARAPGVRGVLGAAGRETVEQRYSLSAWGPRVVALYRELFR